MFTGVGYVHVRVFTGVRCIHVRLCTGVGCVHVRVCTGVGCVHCTCKGVGVGVHWYGVCSQVCISFLWSAD